MLEKGEFEQRSEMKPASSVPLPKEKASPVAKILCVLFALIAVGACGYIVYDKLSSSKKDDEKPEVVSQTEKEEASDVEVDAEVDAEVDEEVRAIVKDVYEGMSDFFADINGFTVNLSFDDGTLYEFEDGYATSIEKSYEVSYILNNYTSDFYASRGETNYINMIDKVMKSHKLTRTAISDGLFYGRTLYYTSDDGYVCTATTSAMPSTVSCSNTKWLSEDRKELVKTLIDTYRKGEASSEDYEGAIYLYANEKDIKDGGTKPYQVLEGAVLGAAIVFYRKSPDDDWIYFKTTQQLFSCDAFQTEDEQKAFKGERCYDSNLNESTVVVKE